MLTPPKAKEIDFEAGLKAVDAQTRILWHPHRSKVSETRSTASISRNTNGGLAHVIAA
jgi:hypothetical protein